MKVQEAQVIDGVVHTSDSCVYDPNWDYAPNLDLAGVDTTYKCLLCERRCCWCFGAADDYPELCDDCWWGFQNEHEGNSNRYEDTPWWQILASILCARGKTG